MKTIVASLACFLSLHLAACANLATTDFTSSREPAVSVLKPRHTLKELRDMHVVKQQTDYSCGASALATLMTYYYKDPLSERRALDLLVSGLPKNKRIIKKLSGFSLLDLKRVAVKRGYRAAGFEITFEQLLQIQAPVIVFISPLGYPHFAVLRDIIDDRVYLADPARGNLLMSITRFLSEWKNIIFVLGKPGEEDLFPYPLAVGSRSQDQPAPVEFNRMMSIGTRVKNFTIRTRLP